MRRAAVAAGVIAASLVAGLAASRALDGALAIRFRDKELPAIPRGELPASSEAPRPRAGAALPLRLVGPGGVGIQPDPEHWRTGADDSHHSWALRHVLLLESPWVDAARFAEARAQWRAYLARMQAYGFNGVTWDAFLELVDFVRWGDGQRVYPEDSPWRARHAAWRAHLRLLFADAHALGMQVILGTDMLALTEPLQRALAAEPGGLDARGEATWSAYAAAVDELFDVVPEADGLLIRVGEAGAAYGIAGWPYWSELAVRDADAVKRMLRALLPVVERRERTLVFRTWTVGVGDIGDLHTSPATYERVLGDVDSPRLVVSTKLVMGDFYGYLPFNPTLRAGRHRRIVELQARREFEGFGAFPNDLLPLHREALRALRDANPRIEGIWLWPQRGGPVRRGPMTLYPFHGDWTWVDANVYGTGLIALDPELDPGAIALAWAERTVPGDPTAARALAEVLVRSRRAVEAALYVGCFARRQALAFGLEPPPQLWIFEWDMVDGSSAALSAVHHLCRHELDGAIEEGRAAAAEVAEMRDLLTETAARGSAPGRLAAPIASLDYAVDLFETLAVWRETFLRHYDWLATGDPAQRTRAREALAAFERRRDAHLARYGSDLEHPAYDFRGADAGSRHMRREPLATAGARCALLASAAVLACGARAARHGRGGIASALWVAISAPWRLGSCGAQRRDAGTVLAAAVLTGWAAAAALGSSFASPAAVLAALAIATAFSCVTTALLAARGGAAVAAATTSAPLVLGVALALALIAVRGPLFFWSRFWTDPAFRALFVTAAAMAVGWGFAAIAWGGAAVGWGGRAVAGAVTAGLGAALATLGLLLAVPGLERALTAVNDDLAVLPLGLSRILGITVHLNLPATLPDALLVAGAAIGAAGLALHVCSRSRVR